MASPIIEYIWHLERRNLRPTYVYHQRLLFRRLARFVAPLTLLDVTHTDLIAYLDSRQHSPGARAAEITHLRSFYAWAVENGLLETSPARRLVKPRQPRRLPRPIPDEHLALALAKAPPRESLILHLAAYAGLRACEIAQMRAEDIDRRRALVIVNESKGGHTTVVALGLTLLRALDAAGPPVRGWLFPRTRGSGHLSAPQVSQIANRWFRELGLPYTLHQARHSFGTAIYKASDHDIRATQDLLRHRSPEYTALYTYIAPGALRSVVDRMPAFA